MEAKRILLLLTIACLCHKGIHIPSLCAFYGNVLRKILPNKRRRSRRAHTESAVNTPLVTEQMTESVHTTSLWPSWNGKSGKPLFIHKLAHACIQMCLEKHFLFCCCELGHSRFNIDIITTVLFQQAYALMLWAWPFFFFHTGLPLWDTVDAEIKIPCWKSWQVGFPSEYLPKTNSTKTCVIVHW